MKARVILYCVIGGIPLLIAALGAGHWTAWWLAGIVLAIAFVPVARYGPRSIVGQFGAVATALLIITALCTWSEALLFVNEPRIQQHRFQALIGSCVMYLIIAGVLALLAKSLGLASDSAYVSARRGLAATALLVPLCGFVYLVCYFAFGALTYQFFTARYYPDAAKLVAQLGGWFWLIQLARGILMTLAVMPMVYTLRLRRWKTAVVCGAVIWIAGGLAPLLMPNDFLSPAQRLIHVFEILTQNFPLGLAAGWLLLRSEELAAPANEPKPNARPQVAGQ